MAHHAGAGWFADPGDPRLLRWWNGHQWTAHTAPRLAGPAPSRPLWPWVAGSVALVACVAVVLLAVAVPTFLGAQERAHDRTAQSAARSALTAARVVQADARGDLSRVTPEALQEVEPTLLFTEGPSTGPTEVSVAVAPNLFMAAARADSGFCWAVVADSTGSVVEGEVVGGDCVAGPSGIERFRPSSPELYD